MIDEEEDVMLRETMSREEIRAELLACLDRLDEATALFIDRDAERMRSSGLPPRDPWKATDEFGRLLLVQHVAAKAQVLAALVELGRQDELDETGGGEVSGG